MKKKLIGIFVCMLLITIVLPVSASYEENNGIETQDWFFGRIIYIGIISDYTRDQQSYEIDFVNGIVFGFLVTNGAPGVGFELLKGVQVTISTKDFSGILTNHLCIGVQRIHSWL